jgi:hypothetical protein
LTFQFYQNIDISAVRTEIAKYPALREWRANFGKSPIEGSGNTPQVMHISVPRDIYDEHAHAIDKDKRDALRKILTSSGLFSIFKYTDYGKPLPKREEVKKRNPQLLGRIVSTTRGKPSEGQENPEPLL